jgi:hypothetical protein
MDMILTFFSRLPETASLLIVGSVLIAGGVLLRRALVVLQPASQTAEPEEQPLD